MSGASEKIFGLGRIWTDLGRRSTDLDKNGPKSVAFSILYFQTDSEYIRTGRKEEAWSWWVHFGIAPVCDNNGAYFKYFRNSLIDETEKSNW